MGQILNNIFLVGNGFDRAHGYLTSYEDFYLWIIKNSFQSEEIQENFVSPGKGYETVDQFLECISDQNFSNELFELISRDFATKKWCDIEALYFSELIEMNSYNSISELNADFRKIKENLEKYLAQLAYKLPSHDYFLNLFNLRYINRNLIVNCNYTNTLNCYEFPSRTQI